MTSDTITEEEYNEILLAIAEGGKVWENQRLNPIKAKIKLILRLLQNQVCCYCFRDILGEFNMVLDIEHVLPKGKYPQFMFDIPNLAIACKRCNMSVKSHDDSFIKDKSKLAHSTYSEENYQIIHPTIENFEDHIKRKALNINKFKFVKYVYKHPSKGKFHYDYFKLKDFEINDLDDLQGVNNKKINYEAYDIDNLKKIIELLENI